ncbi:PAS domain-containing protein [Fulvimonas yonginensis]|uniref:histidine kinase n=1 Tax=Fulvimonas yonginensis TaxID=1495200 RepID=A0ABU8JEW9_9GAMM
MEALGGYLHASRVDYGEVTLGTRLAWQAGYTSGLAPGEAPLAAKDLGTGDLIRLRQGLSVVSREMDGATGPLGDERPPRDAFAWVPIVRDGHWVAVLYVQSGGAHHWLPEDVALLEDVAGRIWSAAEQAETETALRKSEQRFRALMTAGTYAVYRMNPDWTQLRQLEGMGFLADTNEPSEAWLDAYVHPDDQRLVMQAVREASAKRHMYELEHRVRLADGTYGWTHSRAVPIFDDAGHIVEWFGTASDVTERRRGEEALKQLTAELEERVAKAVEERQAALAQVHECRSWKRSGS